MNLRGRVLDHLSRLFPRLWWQEYARKARRVGLDRLYLILSFDCDTPEDMGAAEQLDPWLRARGIKATYAVPSVQLEQGAAVYRRLADQGADFINHGSLPHTEWRDGRYWSITFYHEMTPQEVIDDIRRGHDIVERVIGRAPLGFRAPHFGLFQKPEQLRLLHTTLRQCGYIYSTSTTPEAGYRRGPVWQSEGIHEIPVSGSYSVPLSAFDSWSYVTSPYQPSVTGTYEATAIGTMDHLLSKGIAGVLNWYVDPAHVSPGDHFRRVLEAAMERQIPTLFYHELVRLVSANK